MNKDKIKTLIINTLGYTFIFSSIYVICITIISTMVKLSETIVYISINIFVLTFVSLILFLALMSNDSWRESWQKVTYDED